MESNSPPAVSLSNLVLYFLRLGALGFGGPVALCGQMERETRTGAEMAQPR